MVRHNLPRDVSQLIDPRYSDYARTKKALDSCQFCYQDDRPPQTASVALGKRTYLCCTQTEELVKGHCLIVPIQHCLSTLEMDDEDWDEVKVCCVHFNSVNIADG